MMALIYSSEAEFNARNQEIQDELVKRVSGYNANKWCEPIVHPATGQYALTVTEKIQDLLEPTEIPQELGPDWFDMEIPSMKEMGLLAKAVNYLTSNFRLS